MKRAYANWLCTLIAGCGAGNLPAQAVVQHREAVPVWSDSLRASGRREPTFTLALAWSRRGNLADSVLLQPGMMYADSAALWIVDFSPARVVMLDAARGNTRRVVGRIGRGPGEWVGPLILLGRRRKEIGVFDSNLRRSSWMSEGTALLYQEPLNPGAGAGSACVLGDNGFLASTIARPNSTRLVRVSGSVPPVNSVSELPWPALRLIPAVASQVRMQATNDGCLVFPLYASGLARYDRSGTLTDTIHLIESSPSTVVDERKVTQGNAFSVATGSAHGVNAAAHFGPLLVVAFGGRSAQRERLLDFYDWSTKQYVGSLKTALDVNRIAATASMLYLQMLDDDGLYRLQALRIVSRTGPTPQ